MTMDRKTMKLVTINRAMHGMSEVDRIYLPGKNNLACFVKNVTEKMLVVVRRSNMVNSEEAADNIIFKKGRRNEYLNSWTKILIRRKPENKQGIVIC